MIYTAENYPGLNIRGIRYVIVDQKSSTKLTENELYALVDQARSEGKELQPMNDSLRLLVE